MSVNFRSYTVIRPMSEVNGWRQLWNCRDTCIGDQDCL